MIVRMVVSACEKDGEEEGGGGGEEKFLRWTECEMDEGEDRCVQWRECMQEG